MHSDPTHARPPEAFRRPAGMESGRTRSGVSSIAFDLRRGTDLSLLWLLVMLSLVFRDLHEIATQEYFEEVFSRTVSDGLLLVAGIVLTLPILMVPLSRMLPRGWSRLANLVVVVVFVLGIVAYPPGDLDDVWFAAVQIGGLAAIAWLAWTWPAPRSRSPAG